MTRMTEAQVRAHNAGIVKAITTRNKYGAKKVVIDGITFDSKAEGRRYSELKLMWKGGLIDLLVCHPEFPITIKGKPICIVELDFSYRPERDHGITIYEDVKGKDTDISRLKRKMVEAYYGIKVDLIK